MSTLDQYKGYANKYADQYGIPQNIFNSLIQTESSWNSRAVSNKGAVGLGQIMPATAKELGVDPWNPEQNVEGSARFLSQQYKKYGNWQDALSYYNAGHNLSAGRGYAAKVLAGAGIDSKSGQSQATNVTGQAMLDAFKTFMEFSAKGGVVGWGAQKLADASGVNEAAKAEAGTPTEGNTLVKEYATKYGLWVLAALILMFGIWKMTK